MTKGCWTGRGWTAVLAAGWLALAALPVTAQDAKPAADKAAAKPAAETSAAGTPTTAKKTTAQQQRMKDCAGKWKDEKAAKNVKGRGAYRTFMSGCLKG